MRLTLALFAAAGLLMVGCTANNDGTEKMGGETAMTGEGPTTEYDGVYVERRVESGGNEMRYILVSDEAVQQFSAGNMNALMGQTISFNTEKGTFRLEGVQNMDKLMGDVEKDFGVELK